MSTVGGCSSAPTERSGAINAGVESAAWARIGSDERGAKGLCASSPSEECIDSVEGAEEISKEDSDSGICTVASATCSHGIGDGRPVDDAPEMDSIDSGIGVKSATSVGASSTGSAGMEICPSAPNEERIGSGKATGSGPEGGSGSGIWTEESATCSHGMGEGIPFTDPVSESDKISASGPLSVSGTSGSTVSASACSESGKDRSQGSRSTGPPGACTAVDKIKSVESFGSTVDSSCEIVKSRLDGAGSTG